jgi:transcriptional regulator with XRE-family HTH domain
MTQPQLAKAMRVTQATVSRWETRGAIHSARMDALVHMAREHEFKRLSSDQPSLREAATALALAAIASGVWTLHHHAQTVLRIVKGEGK